MDAEGARHDIFEMVGLTPLVRLSNLSAALKRSIFGKCEFLNPGGSVKDRAAKFIIRDAEESGRLRSGGVIVEGTAGNTGIALAMLGNSRGYKTVIFIPDDQAPEKIDILHAHGADVHIVPTVAYTDESNYYHQARRFAEQTQGAVWADQFNNTANRRAHVETTGPEIWTALGASIDAFVCAAGTGGTIAGVSAVLKERKPSVRVVLADPLGSALYSFVKANVLEAEGDSFAEGIGIKRITENFKGAAIDDALRVDDRTMVEMAHYLARAEGLLLGGSSAINVAAAARLASTLRAGSTIVTILCDGGQRYMSRLYSKAWLEANDLLPRATDLSFL